MPAVTTLAFYREPQTVDSFLRERPKSLLALRAACRQEIDAVLVVLREIELDYLHPHETQEDFIRENLFTFKRLMMAGGIREIRKTFDIENMMESLNSLGTESIKYTESMQKVRQLQQHVGDFLPEKFTPFNERLTKVMQCLRKYCLSFYRGTTQRSPDKYLDTPFKYEQKRLELTTRMQKIIMGLTEKFFVFGSVGLGLQGFSYNVQQLARRVGCGEISLLLLLPEACEQVREACQLLNNWIELDKEYVENLGNDLVGIELEQSSASRKYQEEYTKMVQLKHRQAAILKRIDAYEKELPDFQQKKKHVGRRHHLALVEMKKCEYHLHRAKTVLGDIKRHPETFFSEEEMQRAKLESTLELKRQKTIFPKISKKVEITESIVKHCAQRDSEHEADKRAAMELQFQIDKSSRIVAALQEKLERSTRYEKVLRHIFTLKQSPSSMKKIFHNLQMDDRLQNSLIKERSVSPTLMLAPEIEEYTLGNPIQMACRVVAKAIEQDWFRLYFQLPFYPPRGQVDLDADVDRINKRLVRGNRQELATEMLATWRRLHTRANVEALKEALGRIGRQDLSQRVDAHLARRLHVQASQQRSMQSMTTARQQDAVRTYTSLPAL
ncbi:hypothetical protein BOX15_Mlig027336g1 [Macrostomum lignano]|uniref:Uncharacterized protein n=2 Tax=Macrostomum lignano TaxID=282301 RepID=A0A267DU27_9PLAT|nr:hypothetical protein BOX15_Mlig027336g1 [Macrostomum lignano]